jgi:shikimate kinase
MTEFLQPDHSSPSTHESSEELFSEEPLLEVEADISTNLLKGVNLYLIGMMGAGKTTVGRVLAKRLGYRFVDTDAVIEQVIGQPISEIFATSGESAFRELETQVLGQLAAHTRLTIATGGGIVLDRKNWSYLHYGVVVWLDVPIDMLLQRLQGTTNRPLLAENNPRKKLQALLEQRSPLYDQADVRVTLTHQENPSRVAGRVLESVSQALKLQVSPPWDSENVANPGYTNN